MRLRPIVSLATLMAGILTLVPAAAAVAAPVEGTSTSTSTSSSSSTGTGILPGRYIVTLADGARTTPAAAAARARAAGGTVTHVYTSALRGYAASLPSALLGALLRDPRVAAVEPDRRVRAVATQPSAPYGLDRIDQRALPLTGRYDYSATGSGVTAYVLDTGIRLSHRDFGRRAVSGFDAVDGGPADDCNGHGTHVAGTVGGTTYGVAKAVRLVAVRVLDCGGSGATSGVIAGIDWVTAHHKPGQPAVANLSLSGSPSTALDSAVQRSTADGVVYAVAAGNGNALGMSQDACSVSPARVPEVLTVGASDSADRAASFSNTGRCVDLYAPGVDIASAWFSADSATKSLSGTSMAAPHVAGVAALYLQRHRTATPQAVAAAIHGASTKAAVTTSGGGLLGLGGSGEKRNLLFSRVG